MVRLLLAPRRSPRCYTAGSTAAAARSRGRARPPLRRRLRLRQATRWPRREGIERWRVVSALDGPLPEGARAAGSAQRERASPRERSAPAASAARSCDACGCSVCEAALLNQARRTTTTGSPARGASTATCGGRSRSDLSGGSADNPDTAQLAAASSWREGNALCARLRRMTGNASRRRPRRRRGRLWRSASVPRSALRLHQDLAPSTSSKWAKARAPPTAGTPLHPLPFTHVLNSSASSPLLQKCSPLAGSLEPPRLLAYLHLHHTWRVRGDHRRGRHVARSLCHAGCSLSLSLSLQLWAGSA